jgi:hypothetical protein
MSLEKDAINEHLGKNKNCPLCRKTLTVDMLIPNRSLEH